MKKVRTCPEVSQAKYQQHELFVGGNSIYSKSEKGSRICRDESLGKYSLPNPVPREKK